MSFYGDFGKFGMKEICGWSGGGDVYSQDDVGCVVDDLKRM